MIKKFSISSSVKLRLQGNVYLTSLRGPKSPLLFYDLNIFFETYYKMLEEPERDVTAYVEFMLEILADAGDKSKELILSKKKTESYESLLPRRAEILSIIKDHKLTNFDSIRRRFLSVNERTLRYDLMKLCQNGFIQKLGSTRGVYYKAKD